MKFKIRFADQIVGIFTITAVAVLLVLCFFLGSEQKCFVRKHRFKTEFLSASNISRNMSVQYKGFSIGKIDHIELIDGSVFVEFYVLEDYINYIKDGSLVELNVSPIGLGTSFVLHPGLGDTIIPDGTMIPRIDSPEGLAVIQKRRTGYTQQKDSITELVSTVTLLLRNLNGIAMGVNGALNGMGNANTPVADIVGNLRGITAELHKLMMSISDPNGLVPTLLGADDKKELYARIRQALADITVVTENLGSVSSNLDGVSATAGTVMHNIDTMVGDVNVQVDTVLAEVASVLLDVQDVLEGLKNNPLIRKGVPDRSRIKSTSPQLRDNEF